MDIFVIMVLFFFSFSKQIMKSNAVIYLLSVIQFHIWWHFSKNLDFSVYQLMVQGFLWYIDLKICSLGPCTVQLFKSWVSDLFSGFSWMMDGGPREYEITHFKTNIILGFIPFLCVLYVVLIYESGFFILFTFKFQNQISDVRRRFMFLKKRVSQFLKIIKYNWTNFKVARFLPFNYFSIHLCFSRTTL